METVLKERKWKGKDRDLAEKIEEKVEQFKKKGVSAEVSAKESKFSLEKAVENIEKLKDDLGELGNKPWESLYTREEEIIKTIRNLVINIGEEGGEKAIPALKKFSQDKNSYMAWLAAQMLARIIIKTRGENALEETFKGCSKEVETAVNFEKKQVPAFLTTKEGFLATGDREKLTEGLLGLKKIERKLKKQWGDKIIGISVIHGAVGGYFTEGLSDIDFAIFAKEEALKEMFDEHGSKIPRLKIEGISDFHERFVSVDENDRVIPFGAIQYLFSSRFLETSIEDGQRFNKIQKSTLEKLNEDKWDAVRRMHRGEKDEAVEKMGLRFGINEKNLEKLKQIIFLKNIPPTRDETLKIIDKRLRAFQKNEKSSPKV